MYLLFRFTASHPICMETFKNHPQLGRFTLRDEGILNDYLNIVLFWPQERGLDGP